MAEKRFIHRRIVESDKLRALANAGKWRACFYYAAFLAYYDREGRMNANPMLLKGSLFEGYDLTVEDIQESLRDLADVGLIKLYRNGRHEWLIQCEKFLHDDGGFNTPHPKEPPSTLPGPEDAGSTLRTAPEPSRETAGNIPGNRPGDLKVYGEGNTKGKVKGELSSASPTRTEDHDRLVGIWNYHRGALPACEAVNATRAAGFKRLLKEFGDAAFERFEAAVQNVADDSYWQQKNYNIDNLLKPGRVLEKSEKHKANQGMSAGDRKLATTASVIARAIGGLDA
jgi:hypothetical protein